MRGLLGFTIGFILAADGFLFSLGILFGVFISTCGVLLFKFVVR